MAKDTESTYSYNLDIAKLRRGLQDARREISLANAEFKNATAGMGKWSTSATGLEAKTAQLSKTLKGQNAILDNLKAQYDATAQEMGEASPAAQKLKIQMEQQEASCKKTAAQLDYYTQQLEELEREQSEAEKPISKLSDTIDKQERELEQLKKAYANAKLSGAKSEAQELAKQIDKLSGELRDNKSQMEQATTAADKLDKSLDNAVDGAKRLSDGFTVAKGVLADLISSGIQRVTGYVTNLAGEAIKASDSLDKFAQTMGFAGYDDTAIKQARDAVKQYADDTVYSLDDVANTTAQLAANGIKDYTGLTKAAGNLNAVAGGNSDTFTSVAMALTQTAGAGKLTTENWNQLTNAIPGASGRLQDALKRAGAYTGDFRTAMEEGQITSDEFNAAIMELGSEPVAVEAAKSVTTFEGAMGELEATTTSALMDIFEQIGKENLTKFITDVAKGVKDALPTIKDFVQLLVDNGPTILSILAGIGAGLIALQAAQGIVATVTAITKIVAAAKAAETAFAALNIVLGMNPFILLAAAIAAVVVALVTLYNTNEDFREKVNAAWDAIVKFVGEVIEKLVKFFTKTLPTAIDIMVKFFKELPKNFKKIFELVITAVKLWVADMVRKAQEVGQKFITTIITFFQQLPGKIATTLQGAITAVVTWVGQMVGQAREAGSRFITTIITFFQQLPGKIATTLQGAITAVVTWAGQMALQAVQAGIGFINSIVGALGGIGGSVASALQGAIGAAVTFVTNFGGKAIEAGGRFVSNLGSSLAAAPSKVSGAISGILGAIGGFASKLGSTATTAAAGFVKNIVTGMGKAITQVRTIGQNIAKGLANGVRDMAGWAVKKVQGFTDDIMRGVKNFFGIKSPSRLMRDEVGKMLAQGIVVGFGAEMPAALATMRRDMQSVTGNLSSTVGIAVAPQAAALAGIAQAAAASVNQNVTINQTIVSNQSVDRLTTYRATKSALFTARGALRA